eukprot:CAMPEP_0177586420 /NCGR_PEP_ID=MMETSP0419_2-20121207/5061_1 /TAXON_ID=582737 /ORGANISM="Tetraselmis sp., Strain GSL018" /LENGTH=235 /DNA_ID=CAMNT_0019076307 /DNA_START=243 /DNA_END=947 /DNA_ORIENTATION=+
MNDSRDQDPNPKTLIAVGQMTSGSDKEANFAVCSKLAKEARDAGCLALFLPECFSFLGSSWTESIAAAEPLDGPTMSRYRQLARSPPPKTSLVSLPSCQAAPLSRAHARAQQVRLPKIVKPSPAHTPFDEGEKGWEAEVRGAVVGSSDEEGNGLRNRETKLWLSLGGFQQRNDDDPDKIEAAQVDDEGRIAAEYSKVHLFDVDVPGGPVLMESRFTAPGGSVMAADSPAGRLGLT